FIKQTERVWLVPPLIQALGQPLIEVEKQPGRQYSHAGIPWSVPLRQRQSLKGHCKGVPPSGFWQTSTMGMSPCTRCSSRAPGAASPASITSPGTSGLAPEPWPALPPEFILTLGPTRVTPPGSSLTKLPPTLKVISAPASSTTFMPLDR